MPKKLFKFNKYDTAIFLLITSSALGNVGGALQLVRVLSVLFLPWFLRNYNHIKHVERTYVIMFLILLLYAMFSLIWTPDFSKGLKELIYYPIHFLIFLEIICFSRLAHNPLNTISFGWLIAVAMTLVVAYWEINTGQHLEYSAMDADDMVQRRLKIQFAAVAFYNYNCYVTFLCFALSFLFYRTLIVSKSIQKLLISAVIVLASIVILFNASRGGLISMIITAGVFALRSVRKKKNVLLIIIIIAGLSYLLYQYGEIILASISIRAADDALLDGSSRMHVWGTCWESFVNSYGFGCGIGSLGSGASIPATHNMFMEVLMEFGLIFCLAFITFIIKTFRKGIKTKDQYLATANWMFFLALPVFAIINSLYLQQAFVYCSFASIIVFAHYENIRFNHKVLWGVA